jgi:hypothetical protein
MKSRSAFFAVCFLGSIGVLWATFAFPVTTHCIGSLFSWSTVHQPISNASLPYWNNPFALYIPLFMGLLLFRPTIQGALSACVVVSTLLLLFPGDVVLFSTISWIPLVLWSIRKSVETTDGLSKRLYSLLSLLLMLLSALSSGYSFGILALSLAAHLPAVFDVRHRFFWWSLLAASLLVFFVVPEPTIPTYPLSAQVVPDDGIPGNIHPLLGPSFPIPIIDYSAVRQAFTPVVVALIALFLVLIGQKERTWRLGTILSACIFLEVFLPPSLLQISPLQSLSRLLPGSFLVPLLPQAIGVFVIGSSLRPERWRFTWALFVVTLLLSAFQLLPSQVKPSSVPAVDVGQGGMDEKWICSPSLPLVERYGGEKLRRFQRLVTAPSHRLVPKALEDSLNSPRERLRSLVDRDLSTRWSPQQGSQHDEHTLWIGLPDIKHLEGIELLLGKFVSDFPGEFSVSCASTCEPSSPKSGSYDRSEHFSPWLGPVQFSSEGYPYYGSQSDMRVLFSAPLACRCIRITQLSSSRQFDWSIAEIRLIHPGTKSRDEGEKDSSISSHLSGE